MTYPPMDACECRHTERQHWAWMDDGNGRDGSPCKVCDCLDFDPLTLRCAYCGQRKLRGEFLVPWEACCRECLPRQATPSETREHNA